MRKRTLVVGGVGMLALLAAVAIFRFTPLGTTPVAQGLDLRSSSLAGGGQPFAVVAVDLNRDGRVDLAFTNPGVSRISIYLGRGDGTFEPPSHFATGGRPRGIVAADLNGDGVLDLAVAATGQSAAFVHLGAGDGSFGEAKSFRVGSRPFMLEAIDFNHDGHLDLVVANEGEGKEPEEGALSVLLGDGQGGFSVTSIPSGRFGADVAVTDFDGDGNADVALATWGTNDVHVHLGLGDGTFAPRRSFSYEGHGIYRVLAADLDRDGNPDMILTDVKGSSLYILYGDGQGDFPRTRVLPAGRGVRHAVASDLNGDGWLDLASANTAAGEMSVMLSNGRGDFLRTQNFAVGQFPRTVAAADLNGDQRPDLVVANARSDDITVLLNQGLVPLEVTVEEPEATAAKQPESPELSPFRFPTGLALDPSGEHLLVSDEGNHRVARVELASGRVSTVAGTGHPGGDGDGGPAVGARLNLPLDVAIDREGNVYIADFANHRVRKVDPSGTITTLAGTGEAGSSGDGGPAADAQLEGPSALAVDEAGSLYIAQFGESRIRKVDASGTITTVVGGRGGADGEPATEPTLGNVTGLAIDANGDLLIADQFNFRIRRLARDGSLTTVAGTGQVGYAGDGGPATAAQLKYPSGIAADSQGNLFIADQDGNRIRKVTPDGIIHTLAGDPTELGYAGDGGPSTEATIWFPYDAVTDARGNLYFTDRYNHCIRRVDSAGIITTVAGSPETQAGPQAPRREALRLAASGARLELEWEHRFRSGSDANAAYAVAVDAKGGVFVAGDVGSGAGWHILHLGSDGKKVWSYDFDSASVEVPYALTLTPDGQVVTAGTAIGREETHALVISVSRGGEENWRYEGKGKARQILRGIASDPDSNLYLAGEADGKWQVLSLSPTGKLRWTYEGKEGGAQAIDLDAGGRVFVAGNEGDIWRVIQLEPSGKLRLQHGTKAPSGPSLLAAKGIRVRSEGAAVVSGTQRLRARHARVEKLDADGYPLWEYLDPQGQGGIGRAVDIDSNGNAVVVGDVAADWLMLGLDPGGNLLWRFTYDGGGGLENADHAHAVAFHPSGGFVVAGAIHPVPRRPPTLGDVYWRVAHYRVVHDGEPPQEK